MPGLPVRPSAPQDTDELLRPARRRPRRRPTQGRTVLRLKHSGHAVRTLEEWSHIVAPRRLRTLRASLTARRTGIAECLVSEPRQPGESGRPPHLPWLQV